MKRNYYSTNTSFLDLLFNSLLAFVGLFIIAFIVMMTNQNKEKDNKKIDAKAEYIITVTWPNDFNDDVDTYVEDPEGCLVFFRRREDGLMHLDRDDYGQTHDYINTPAGRVQYSENREIITLRGYFPGEYVVNVHLFNRHGKDESRPVPVTVTIDKLNPNVSIVLSKTVTLEHKGDERTVARFTLSNENEVININDLEKSLTESVGTSPGSASPIFPGANP